MKRSSVPLIIGLIVLFFVVTMGLVALLAGPALSGGMASGGFSLPFGERIAILEVEGVLGEGPAYGADTKRLREAVERWTDDPSIKGMVIRINSPGGGVSATQDLYHAVEKFAAEKPVVVSMGDVAASGGYYLAMAADEVYANSGTLTGSVGVILSFWGYQELTDKIGLEPRTVKSGQFKDIGSGSRPMTEEEKALLNDMIQDVYEQFYAVVYDARAEIARDVIARNSGRPVASVTDEEVDDYLRSYCDGRIFSGNQALEYGMVDKLGTLDEAIEAMKSRLGISAEDVHLVLTPKPTPGLFGKMNQKLEQIGNAAPGSVKLEFRFSM
ncbi:MAG: protease [Candidatus Sumerlaeota bacterium]|nr:protease [Candidatus Sumerlaeota bacterium]